MFNPSAIFGRVAAGLALVLIAATPLCAQPIDSIPVGARIRAVRLGPVPPIVGTLVKADEASLVIAPSRGGPVEFASLVELRRVDMSMGGRPAGEAFWRGAGIGLLVGASIGVVATVLAAREDKRDPQYFPRSVGVGALSVVVTTGTTLVGGGIGVATRERWHTLWPAH